MTRPIPFQRHPLAALVAVACGALSGGAQAAPAARIDFATAGVEAVGADGARRPLAKGAEVRVGDAVETNAGRAWLRFTDGGYLSLQPGTVFRVDDYNFAGTEDGSERGFFSLLKGGLRTITGAIGHRTAANYRVNTPVATIGIRGTEYLAVLGDSLTVSCGQGVCVVTNAAGETVLQAGQTVYIEDENSPGQRQTMKPVLPPAPPVEFRSPENRDESGNPVAVIEPEDPGEEPEPPVEPVQLLPDGPGYTIAASFGGDGAEGTLLESPVTADFNADSELESYTGSLGARGTAQFADTGADAIIGWGRWTGGSTAGDSFPHPLLLNAGNQSFHYVVGKETPELPADVIGIYELMGATTPTFSDGGEGGDSDFGTPLSVSGALAADFSNGTVETTLVIDYSGSDLTINSDPIPIIGGTARFAGSGPWADGGPCSGGCGTTIKGFFAGADAERAGYAYDVFVFGAPNYVINGAAVFRLTGTAPPPD